MEEDVYDPCGSGEKCVDLLNTYREEMDKITAFSEYQLSSEIEDITDIVPAFEKEWRKKHELHMELVAEKKKAEANKETFEKLQKCAKIACEDMLKNKEHVTTLNCVIFKLLWEKNTAEEFIESEADHPTTGTDWGNMTEAELADRKEEVMTAWNEWKVDHPYPHSDAYQRELVGHLFNCVADEAAKDPTSHHARLRSLLENN